MGKQQDWSVTAYVFLFLSLTSQIIHCRSQPNPPKRGSAAWLKENDLIKKLPGQPSVSFRQYGGYVSVNETAGRFLYYYFVEAIKSSNSTPLVIWFNGGPACSALGAGAFRELGPFRLHSDGKTLFRNPYSWNNEANLLFLEMPAGVGFSYSNTPIDLEEFGAQADKLTAEENYIFLVNWLKRFPEFKGRDFYIAGQSYAGHYVPQLAQLIIHHNNQNFINLRGILMGNPSIDYYAELDAEYQFMLSHALINQEIMDNYNKNCRANLNHDCGPWLSKINRQKEDLDVYNLYAPVCLNSTLTSKPKESTTIMDFDECASYYVAAYLNTRKVQKAIHANTTKLPYEWKGCNLDMTAMWADKDKETSMIPILQELSDKGVRVLVYSGDMDLAVSVTATFAALKKMNLTIVNEWRQWFSEGQVGGFTEDYKGNISFATVRGAGHYVPRDQPIRALLLFNSFIRNTPLPQKTL